MKINEEKRTFIHVIKYVKESDTNQVTVTYNIIQDSDVCMCLVTPVKK